MTTVDFSDRLPRCHWCNDDPIYIHYHDHEWGVPVFNDLKLFEFLILESMQAGLSWITILRKREAFRVALDGFNPEKIARYSAKKISSLMNNKDIIRNERKILSAVNNAKQYLALPSFNQYIWQFTDGQIIQNHWQTPKEVPTTTPQSDVMAKQLKKDGFTFVGSTTCYAFMQAVGMVNDHTVDCFLYQGISLK